MSKRSGSKHKQKRRGAKRKAGPRYPNGQLRHRPAVEDPPGMPTPQRFRHDGGVAKVDIVDEESRAARPYRATSFLSTLEAAGFIDPKTGKPIDEETLAKMRAAGEDFRALFYKARLDPLGAAQLVRSSRSTGSAEPDSGKSRIETARNGVWRAICAVGGLASLDGSCLWHVVGAECDLARWALEQGWIGRRISVQAAHRILISTLASLKEHDL